MKKIAIGVGIVLGVIILVLALLPFAIDLNRHKAQIINRIRTYTDRQVDFKSIRLTILTGLGAEIKGLRISDDPAFSKEDFCSLDSARVKVAILPLLSRELKVTKVVLKGPQIHVIRDSNGVFNYKTLILPKPGEKPKEKAPKPGALASLLVSNVQIKHGVLTFRDDKTKPGSKPFMINDIDLDSSNISLNRPIPFSLSAAIMSTQGQNFALAGTIGPIPEEGGLELAPVDLHLLLDALPLDTLPVKMPVARGTMKIDITAKGQLKDKITSRTVMDLTGIVIGGTDGKQRDKKLKGISVSLASDAVLELEQQRLLLSNGTFTIGQDRGRFEGEVKNLKAVPSWSISIRSDRMTLGPIMAQLPMFAGLIPGKIALAGPAGFHLTTSGDKAAFQVNTDVNMSPMSITFGKFFDKPVNGPFTIASRMTMKKDLTEITALDFNLGAITGAGSGEVRKVNDKSRFTLRLQTNPVPMQIAQAFVPMLRALNPSGNALIRTTLSGGGGAPLEVNVQAVSERMALVLKKPSDTASKTTSKLLAGPVTANLNGVTLSVDALKKDKALTANGTMKSRGGTLLDLPFSNLASTFSLEDDQLRVNSYDLAALSGSIRGQASYNLKTKAWSAAPAFNNVQAGNVLNILSTFKGVFTGSLSGDIKAHGLAGAPALNNLGAQANLRINKGEWKNFDLAGTVMTSLIGIPGLTGAFGLAPAEVQRYSTTRFESMNTRVDLSRKVINVDTMRLLNISSGKDTDTESLLKGTISMETNQLNLAGQVVLPRRFSQRIGARAAAFSSLMNSQNRLVVPLTITGSLKKPIPMVDVRSLTGALTRYYATRALDQGMKKLKDKLVLPPGTDQTGKDVQNLLEGIFKK